MHEDGKSAIATLPDGTQFLVPNDVLQRIVNNGQYADYKARRDAEASKREAEQSTESAPETATEGGQPLPEEVSPKEEERREYAQGDVFDVVVDGQKMHAEIVSPKDADGRFVVNVDDGESMRTLYVTPEELAAMEYREEPSPKAEETRLATEDSSDKALERGAQPTEEHTPTALERIPRDEKGNAQFHDVDTETAWDGLVEMSGNEETAHKVAEASLANAEKKLKAAKALKEEGETPEELLRSIKENEAAVAEAQRVVDAWKAIVGEKSRREEAAKAEAERIATEKAEAERKAAEERERAEKEEKARIEAEKKEAERIAAEKAEEEARVEAEKKAEAERKAEEEQRAAEEKRIAEEKAEAERKAQEERERAEEERDRIEAELDAQKADEEARLEAERKAEEEAVEKDAELKEDKKKPQLKDVVKAIYEKGKSAASRLYKMAFFDVAKTPDFMKKLGLTGDRFTIKYGVLSRHAGKDDSHSLTEKQWEELPDALQKPFAITRFGGKDKGYRLYTTMKNENGETIVVGVDVKNVGRDMEVNAISTIFGRRGDAKKTQKEDVLYTAENITPEQRSLLGQPNSDQYTGVRERNVSTDKGSEKAEKKQKKQSVFDKAKEIAYKEEKKRKAEAEKQKVDKQGNPIDAEGRLITEKVEDISDLSDDDFNNPTRSVEFPKIPKNVDDALGANGRPVIIKKNIFEKNGKSHGFTPKQSRKILGDALYNPDIVGQSQPSTKKTHWVAIKVDEKSPITILEVNDGKDNVEVVGWYTLDARNLERIKRQAEREGGELLVLSPKDKVESLPTPTSGLPTDKGSEVGGEKQEAEKKRPAPIAERIEDVGEKIGDARKDVWKEIIARIKNKKQGIEEALKKSSAGKLFSSLFDEKELLESGVSNEVVTFISAVKGSLGTKPRSLSKLKMWINKVLHQYDMCEQALENWESVKKKIDEWKYYSQPFYMYRAAMAVGGYESGRDVGNAELWQIADGYSDGKSVAGQWRVRKAGAYDGIYKTYEEAAEALKKFAGENAAVDGKGKRKEVKLAIYKRRTDGTMFIAPEGKPDVIIQDGFKTLYEASAYKKEHYAEMQERYRTLMDGIKPKFNENRERKGRDWRGGKDVSAEDFREAFDFRGVEFGNWMQQKDRRQALNECYDSLMDLAMVCGVSPKALSLGGKLAMAFGARGGGKFNAHYEPDKVVINLTKTKGAGSLAHEWFHAIDNYFNMQGWDEFATESTRNVERKEMAEAWKDLVRAINGSDYFKRSDKYARLKGSRYWIEPTELGARAFAVWVENRLSKYGTINDYLANNPRLVDEKASDAEKKYAPYPFDKDADWMDEKFGRLFEVMQERVDEETGKHILYSRNKAAGHELTELTAEERELRDNLVERMRKGGLDVVTDSEEMQRVIDTENERTRNKRSKKSEAARKRDEALYAVDWSTAFVSGKSREEATEIRRERGRKFKEETKELYGRVLSGNFDDVTLRLIDKFVDNSTPNNPYERPISKRLPARALQKMRGGERTGSIDALFSRISESAVGKDGKALPRAERERAIEEKKKELLKKWAIATGNWHTDIADFTDQREPIGSGTDSDVYLGKDGKSVIKVSKGKPYGKRFRPDVDNVALFNTVFPGSRYTIEGYGEINGKFVRFLKQPIVDFTNSTPLTEGERVAYMEKLGFKPINKENTAFSNGEIIASDLQKSNIVKDKQGNVRVIDADMKLHTKDFGGKFSYPDAETDTRTADGEMNTGSVREHRVYHGSGADFDAFDHSHIGEGEGAQAYGWGTYVTEVEGIGKTYANATAHNYNKALRPLERKRDSIRNSLRIEALELDSARGGLRVAVKAKAKAEENYEEFLKRREEIEEKYGKHSTQYDDYLWNSPYAIAVRAIEHYENEIKERETELHSLQKDLEETRKQIENIAKEYPHHLYTVEIPDDNGSNYLDWNGHPAESLLKDVGSFLESEGFERVQDSPVRYEKGESTVVLNPNATGADLYAELREALGSDKKASQALAELGCIGIKYPADNMRGGREDGAKNYVIFNENDAKITDHTRFLRTADGEVYGLVKDGRIYLDPKVATAETAVHEYTHLWGDMLRRKDSEQWSHTVKELKNSVLWEEVKESYPELKTDDEIADEVLSTFSGRRGAERLREEARRVADGEGGVFTKAKAIETLERVKEAIARFWEGVARMFGINRYRSAEELADMAMRDLINGVKPTSRTFTFDNFYKDTKAVFEGTERPKGKPDYTSYSGSEYWYGEDKGGKYVVRGSDHWSGEFKVKDGERTNVGRNHYSEITEDGMLPIGAQGSLKFGWEKGLSKPVGSGISAAIDRRGSGDSNNIASCYWYIDNAKEKDNKGFTYGKAYLSEFEDKERRRDIPGDDWRDIQGLEGGTRNMFVGEKGATEADKAEDVSTRLDNLSVARRMEEAGKDAKAIKMATGWERGTDGKWRYETGDAKIKDTIELDGKTFKRYDEDMLWTSGKFGDVVDAPELFKAYPELRDVRIETDAVLNDMPSNGEYNPRTNTITIHSDDLKYQNSILNHEIQHAIQHIEGFETGGSAENVRERIQQIIDNSSDEVGYARERLREWADLNAMAAMLDVAYRKFVGSGNEWERAKAVEIYWDAINTIEDNDKAELAINYPHDKTPREVAESGYLVDDVIRELNRLADETRKEIPDGNIDTMRKVDRLVGALKDKTDFELYNRLAGEVEARNTEKRIGMTEEERRASLASETEDVAREDQILLRQGLDGINIMRSEAAATPLKGDEALTALDSIFGENEGSAIPPKISSFAKFKNLFKKPVRTFLGELVQVKDEVWNKILRNNRQDITGTVLPTIENADFAIRDTDGSTLYVKRFKGDGQERMYNVVVVNKHGEVEDYISSVHIKRDNNLRNKIKKGAELFLPNARTTDGTLSRNNSTPGAKVANYSETAKPRFSRKPGESIFDYASRVSEDVDRSVRERVSARDEYEKKVKSKGFQTKEALQNSMLGLQEFMSAIDHASGNKRYIEDIPDFENPILGENRLSSVNKEEMHQVAKTQFKPLMSAVAKLSGNDKESGELYDYMFAKHGLERDAVMRQREAQKEFDKYQKANPKGTKTIGDFVASLEGKDYAGLTALTAEDGRVKSIQSQIDAIDEQMKATDDQLLLRKLGGQKKRLKVDLLNAARDAADDIRKTFESDPNHDRSDINELWSRVNEVNGNTLRKLYESGMLTKEAYNDISSMYTNYIPMRGFDQTTSADAYAYLTHGDSAFNAPIKTAKGRSSKADNPIAYMQAMAESAIMQGNRNVLVKQKMLNFVRNHPSDLASVSDVWLQYDSVADEWKPFYGFGRESKG